MSTWNDSSNLGKDYIFVPFSCEPNTSVFKVKDCLPQSFFATMNKHFPMAR